VSTESTTPNQSATDTLLEQAAAGSAQAEGQGNKKHDTGGEAGSSRPIHSESVPNAYYDPVKLQGDLDDLPLNDTDSRILLETLRKLGMSAAAEGIVPVYRLKRLHITQATPIR
jgi:hypothetical protein